MKRRHFLIGGGVSLGAGLALTPALSSRLLADRSVFGDTAAAFTPVISAANTLDGEHRVGLWDRAHWRFSQSVSERGHDSAWNHQRGELLFFARRPGRHLTVLDARSGEILLQREAAEGFHYYGHGCLSADGKRLYTTENHYANDGAGAIGVYDAERDYQLIQHFDCRGIGPHQLALMPDGDTLVIAIGGIKTLPDSGRDTLNPDSLAPALIYMDRHSGTVVERVALDNPALSLRHLDVARDGRVVVGTQNQASTPGGQPLVYWHRRGQALQPFLDGDIPLPLRQDYVASVSIDSAGHYAVTTLPRDNLVCLWDMRRSQLDRFWSLRDCAGAVFDAAYQQFLISNGAGQLFGLRPADDRLRPLAYASALQWDNHMTLLG